LLDEGWPLASSVDADLALPLRPLQLALLRQSQGLRGASQALRKQIAREYGLQCAPDRGIVNDPVSAADGHLPVFEDSGRPVG